MKYCTKCGKQLDDDAMFCPACGTAVGASAAASVNAPSADEPKPANAPSSDEPFADLPSVNAAPPVHAPSVQPAGESALKTIAKVFMLLSCIFSGFLLIPLAWTVPMTVVYWKKVSAHQPVGTGFKVCTLIFVDLIAGILMLCDDTPN